jgi:hypothetical protein
LLAIVFYATQYWLEHSGDTSASMDGPISPIKAFEKA